MTTTRATTEATTATMTAEQPAGRGTRVPARVRIMGWLVLVMTGGLATVVLLVATFEYRAIERRVNSGLEQDAGEFRRFAGFGAGPAAALFDQHLRSQYPDRAEVMLGITPEGPGYRSLRQGDQALAHVPLGDALLRAIVTSPATTGTVDTEGGELRWLRVDVLPETGGTQPSGWFVSGYFLDEVRADAAATVRTLVVISAIALVLAAGVSWLVAGQILAPVNTVRRTAARLTEHDLTHRIPVHGRDDIAALARQFNAMLDRLESAFATRRQFLDDAGHELRTPITIIRGHLEVMGDDPAERAEVVRLCTDELDRMARIVDDLLLLAKAEQPDFLRPEWTSVPELTSDIDAKVRALAPREWLLELVGEGEAWLDGQRVTQAMVQLAQNAVQHTAEGAPIRIGSVFSDGTVSFWVTDSGPGVSTEDIERIFGRFVRGEAGARDGAGAGLGLAIVKAIAEAHHGTVRVLSEPGQGATFGLELPARGW
ncbi:sensor histidine kinase [Prauserella muralis]|uniref:histidine kinase n=1 Tax=Prauserella muralis TaxID=588067 RepID=A0A2V4AHX0_9PSEU|nr:ATP-binding protein [Prauserella muralis]PXY19508.1 two-component sensor histidine kinase [Prauserella muralis]TWE29493.1 signal transduction histidine kinase [Prauserella muralis]